MVDCQVTSIEVLKQVLIIEVDEYDDENNENDLIESILNELKKSQC